MAAQRPKYYRYSIPQLLEISTHITTPFDLSRLSFNAVRAGIVPALSGSVMAPRESAVQPALRPRNRGSSQQTSSASATAEEQIVCFEYPVRQPKNAPPEPRTQIDKGFAHFLKTHSSPNHTRVTAGGRIVPMEKRPAPPRFALSASKDHQNTGSVQRQMVDPNPQPFTNSMIGSADRDNNNSSSNNASSPTRVNTLGYDTASKNTHIPSTVQSGLVSAENPSLTMQQVALESNIHMQNQLLAYGLGNGTLYPALPGIASQVPILGQQYPVNLPYLPYGSTFAPPGIGGSSMPMGWDAGPHLQSTLHSRLNEANNDFEMYQQQLRDLDRYRATHQRDDVLVRQRVDIIARRAEVKDEIRRLQAAIGLHERNQGLTPAVPPTWTPAIQQQNVRGVPIAIKEPVSEATPKTKSSLNVAAAAYVPKSICGPSPPSTSELRMQNLPATQYSRIDIGNPELKATDAWGERLGDPPPQLLRDQCLLAEQLLSELNTPKGSDDDESDSASALSHNFADSTGPRLDPRRSDRPPPSVEADYEKQIDAMRKPNGTTTQITLSDGQMQLIPGMNLKPPAAENMTDFERAYWQPAHPDYLGHGNKENSQALSFTAKTSTLSFENHVLSQDQAKAYRGSLQDSPSRQALSELSATLGYNHNSVASHSPQDGWDMAFRELQVQGTRQASSGNNYNHGIGSGSVNDALDQEAIANKAYSSTVLQGIHAIASLPRSLDGAVEANLLKLKGSPRSPKSPKSPRTIFRSAGDAWFGPFRRNFYDTKSKNGETGAAR